MSLLDRHLSLAALLLAAALPARAVLQPIRLYEIPVTRFVVDGDGQRRSQYGQLDSAGSFRLVSEFPVPESVTIPAAVVDRWVITTDAWNAYARLGPSAVGNFQLLENEGSYAIGMRYYHLITPNPDARFDLGDLVNLSTRGSVQPGAEPMIGGLIVENQYRWVLIRGVGPSLAPFGVPQPVPDPHIILYKAGGIPWEMYNDDWEQRPDADTIERVTGAIGAFPLPRGSKDAALLVELPPGAYTIHLAAGGETGGTGLIEVYLIPEDVL